MKHFVYIFILAVISIFYCSPDDFSESSYENPDVVTAEEEDRHKADVYCISEEKPNSDATLSKTNPHVQFSCCEQQNFSKSKTSWIYACSCKKEAAKYKLFKTFYNYISANRKKSGYYIYYLRKIII